MRTIYTVTTDSEIQIKYYEEDESLIDSIDRWSCDRKSASEVDRMTQALWGGTLAQEESFKGPVAREDFKTILRGTLPSSGQRIRGVRPNPNDKERLADDVVLSAPKSFSMALHLEKDMRLFDANLEAVQETLAVIEQELAQTRIQVHGVRQTVPTGKLLAVLMPHHTSRDGDLQLHTHLLIMNGSKAADGIWRSLYHESLSKAEWIGSFYRQRLAEKVQALGYRIYPTEYGFELQGYSRDDIEVFSKRNQTIVEAVKRAGLTVNAENKQQKVLPTRKAKSKSAKTLEEIQALWRAEACSKSVGSPVLDHPIHVQPKLETAVQGVNRAIQDLSEHLVSFSRDDIYASAFKQIHAQGLSFEHINHAIKEHKSLLDAGNGRFTTVQALEQETQIKQRWMAGQGKATPLFPKPDLTGTQLNSGQAEAVYRTLTSTDSHQIIPRLSKYWKTKLLNELTRQLEGSEIEIRAFCPTIDAARKFQQLGIQSHTIEQLVASQPEQIRSQLWIIDKAETICAKQMLDIQSQADAVKARILLVGDKGHGSSVAVGSPLRSLIKHGATSHTIKHLIRQQTSMQRQAVELLIDGKGGVAPELLSANGYIREIADPKGRAAAIANQYLGLTPKERNQTVIKTASKDECLRITQAIRTRLRAEVQLANSIKTVQLVPRQLSDHPSLQIGQYQAGDYIKLHRNYRSTPLCKGQLYKVEGRKGDELVVSSYGGRLFRFNPSCYKDKSVYQGQEIEIAVGDRFRWTSTDKTQGQVKGKSFTVASIEATTLSIINQNEQAREISLLKPLAIDHDWVSTVNQAPGKSAKRVILSAATDLTSAQEPFYITLSHQVRDINVYTENLQGLLLQCVSPAMSLELGGKNNGGYRNNRRFATSLQSSQVSPTNLESDSQRVMQREHLIDRDRIHSLRHQIQTSDTTRLSKPDSVRIETELQQGSVVKRPYVSEEQDKLNQQALDSSKRLLRRFGTIQSSGELSWISGSYTFCADQKRLRVGCHQRQSILELQEGQLTGSVTPTDVQRFKYLENAVAQSLELE